MKAGIREQGLGIKCGRVVVVAMLLLGAMSVAACAQIVFGPSASPDEFHPGAAKQHVTLMSDSAVVPAGQPQVVELAFRVQAGLHINSHTPKDQLLIPTVFLAKAGAVKVVGISYPHGSLYRLPVGGGELMSVYQDEFKVELRVVAPRGDSTLKGALRYQACGSAGCFPAKTLPVKVAVTGQ